jgi:osmotically inducible protein OsmC
MQLIRISVESEATPRIFKESIMAKIDKVLTSGNTHATVNRDPNVQRGEFGVLDLKLSAPGVESLEFIATELHPRAEQLFSGAWSACYIIVFGMAAQLKKVTLPPDYSVDIQVNIGKTGTAWFLGAEFTIRVPGLEKEVVEAIAHSAHQICPYSKAVHGNIEVSLNVITA